MLQNDRPDRISRLMIHGAAGVSGFFVMGIELLGGRVFAPFFGTSIFVWGAIISVFMTALALGYLVGGTLSTRRPSIGVLGCMLLAEGVACLPIVLIGEPVLEFLSYLIPDARYGSLIGSAFFFALPAFVSGMVSPYAVRLLTHSVSGAGQSAGKLYFMSTLGSALGTIITSFYLVMYLRLDTIIMGLILLVMLLGLTLLMMARRRKTGEGAICALSS